MGDVMAMHAVVTLDLARKAGVPIDGSRILAGLPYTEDDLRSARRRRIPWDDYALILDRWCEACGGYDTATAIATDIDRASTWFDWMLATLVSPLQLFRFWSYMVPLIWRPARMEVTGLDDGTLRVRVRILPGYRDSVVLHMVNRGAFATVPRRIGLPPAHVVLEHLAPREAVYRITPSPAAAPSPQDRMAAMVAVLEGTPLPPPTSAARRTPEHAAELGAELVAAQGPEDVARLLGGPGPRLVPPELAEAWQTALDASRRDPADDAEALRSRVDALAAHWHLTPTQHLVLFELVRGLSNKEIAAELGMAEATVETHVTRIFRKSGVRGRTALVAHVFASTPERGGEP